MTNIDEDKYCDDDSKNGINSCNCINKTKEFNFNDDDFLQFNLNAIDCAFLSDEEKENIRNLLLDNWS